MTRPPAHAARQTGADPRPVAIILTVGGSADPVRRAIETSGAAIVWFIVSARAERTESSRSQAEAIARDLGLSPANHAFLEVPADDPDAIMTACRLWLRKLRRELPDHRIIADYTGGTKSMSAGLLWAALNRDDVEVQFMVGERPDLSRVSAGTEVPRRMTASMLLLERELDRIVSQFRNRDYGAALSSAKHLYSQVKGTTARRVQCLLSYLVIIEAWDRFDHGEAWRKAQSARDLGHRAWDVLVEAGLAEPLEILGCRNHREADWAICADLWLNCLRSAERRRFDDAIARAYRLTEACLQAQLWTKHQLGNPVPSDHPKLRAFPDRDRYKIISARNNRSPGLGLGLDGSARLLLHLDETDEVARALSAKAGDLTRFAPEWLSKRNRSILAHGFTSAGEADWQSVEQWLRQRLRPFWKKHEPSQFPRELPDHLLNDP